MSHKTLLTTFIGGEVSSKMQNRFDYEKYQSSARWIENWYITKEGNINFRTGTYYSATIPNMVNYAGTDRPARLFQWLRRDNLIFLLCFRYDDTISKIVIDIYQNFALIDSVNTDYTVDALDKIQCDNLANTLYITDGIRQPYRLIYSVGGFTIEPVKWHDSETINASTFMPPWQATNTGAITLTASATTGDITLTASAALFAATDVYKYIKIIKTADSTYGWVRITGFTSPTVVTAKVYKTLTVSGPVDDWALSVVPTTVLFYQGRLWYGDENKIVGSRTQTTDGTPRFDDFTMGSDADHAINLTNTIFKNPILWMKVVNNALIAGTSTQIYKIKCYNDPVVTTTNLPEITPISNEGSKNIIPLQEQNNIFYVSIIGTTNDNGSRLSAIKYDYLSEGYQVLNTNIYSDEINKEGIIQCAYVKGYDDILYCLKSNGEITGMNYNPDQQIMGWFRTTINGWNRQKGNSSDTSIESICTLRQTDGSELLVMIVKRVADGDTIRTIEYLSQPVQAVDEMEFYTGVESYDSDEFTYYLWQSQLNQNYLDCAYIYNGTQSSSATISSTGTGEKTFTCAGYTFVAGDVGREIREDLNYDFSEGNAEIIEFVSDHVVKVNVRAEFSALSLTSWVLTTNELTLSSLFYGKKVATLIDGGKGQEYTVANDGTLTLQYQGAYIIVGFKYIGLVKTLNLNAIFKTGNTSDMFKQVANIWASFYNTVSCKFGTTLYNYDELFIGPSNPLGKPPVVYNGMKELHIQDNPRTEKYIYFIKDDYSSCNIQLLNINIDYK